MIAIVRTCHGSRCCCAEGAAGDVTVGTENTAIVARVRCTRAAATATRKCVTPSAAVEPADDARVLYAAPACYVAHSTRTAAGTRTATTTTTTATTTVTTATAVA